MQNKGKIFKSGLIFIILSGIIILIFSCLTVFLTKKLSSAPFVEKMIKDKVGLNSSIINPKVKLAGIYLTFMADDIILYGESEKKPFVDIKDLKLKVSPLKVLTKKISILEFNSSDIFLNLSRENDGSLDITKYLKNNNKSKFKIDFTPLKSYILRYNINYADKIINSGFNIKGSSLLIEDLNIQKQLKFETLGQISINTNNTIYNSPYLLNIEYTKKGKNIDLKKQEILISGIDISFLKNYLSKFGFKTLNSKIDIVSFAKNSNMFKLYFVASNTNMAFDYKGDTNTIISNDPLINEVDFTFDSKDLIIDKGLFVGNGFNFSYSGNIKNVTNLKNLEAQLSLKIANSDLKSILAILPDTVLPLQEPYIKNMKRYNANALIDGNVDFKYKNKDEYGAKGKLDFYDVYVVKRPDCAPTSFGSAVFNNRDVDISVYANAPNNSILTVFGKTKMQKMPPGEFYIESNGPLDLKFAHEVLMPVQKILALKMGPLPYMTLKGTGEIKLHTKGTKQKANLYGKFSTKNATVTMDGINAILEKGAVDVLFDGSNITFNGANGYINGAKTNIDGSADTDGNLNVDVKVEDINSKSALDIAITSTTVLSALDGGEFLNTFKPESGNIDFYLNLNGNIPPDAIFGAPTDSLKAKGRIDFKGVNLSIEPKIKGANIKGVLNFENSADFNLNADIFNSPFKITGTVEQKGAKNKILHDVPAILTLELVSDNLASQSVGDFIIENLSLFAPPNRPFARSLALIFKSNNFKLKGDVKAQGNISQNSATVDLSEFNFDGNIYGINSKDSDFIFKEGNISLKDKNAKFNKLNILALGINLIIDGSINKFASIKPFYNLKIDFVDSPLSSYVAIIKNMLSPKIKSSMNNLNNFTGTISGSIKLFGDKTDGNILPKNISFTDTKYNKQIKLNNGTIKIRNDKTILKDITLQYGTLPFYLDGFIETSGSIDPKLNLYFKTDLSESACDELINPYVKYPLLITNNVLINGRIQGSTTSYVTYLNFVLEPNSDISFMGLKLHDSDLKREISSKIKFTGNHADINYVKYLKYILKNNKQTPYEMINVSGGVEIKGKDAAFKNVKIYTPNPAPVRFINPIFKKSILKGGEFTSNVTLNGTPSNMSAIGNLTFSNVAIPVFGSFINDIKVNLNNKTGKIDFALSAFDTDADFTVDFENKITLPFVINNISIHSPSVSVQNLVSAISELPSSLSKTNSTLNEQNQTFVLSPNDVQIKKGSLLVDKIMFNGVEGTNLKLNFAHSKDASFIINDSYLSLAGGLIKGSGVYSFENNSIKFNSDFINCDANELSKAFLNVKDQVFGNSKGTISLNMSDFNSDDYIKKLNADAEFEIQNGRLPKLGSIEYLLRASNVIKSGIFGLTLNNVIELLTPYKHGDFNKISGNLKIKDAKITDLKLYSQGENLSTYTYGSYDIILGIADLEILGKLSKKISNLLGPLGNTSVASVINAVTRNKANDLMKTELMKNVNKIPLIDLSNDDFRLFNVKLDGQVSADDVVKSFTWLN